VVLVHRLPTATLTIGPTTVCPVSSVCVLGIFVDSDLVMCTHVCRTLSHCFVALRQLLSIRHLVSATVFQSLVAALVLSRLDNGNGASLTQPSTSVGPELNSAAHIRITSLTLSSVFTGCECRNERIVFKVTHRADLSSDA